MDTIFTNCKRGDLERVKYFVEKKEVDVNARDNWDSTPLYYACLCGHFNVVEYLLANGARCEEGSRDGERCVYGALTDDIREYLLKSQIITPETKTRDEYQNFCERLWKSTESDPERTDFKFVLDDSSTYRVHRSILCARSEYFRQKFQDEWRNRKSIVVRMMNSGVFASFLQYIYTGKTVVPKDKIDELCHFAALCQLSKLEEETLASVQKVENFVHSKYGVRLAVSKITVESQKLIWDVQQDFGLLISLGLPPEYCDWLTSHELPFMSTPRPYFDLCFCVDDKEFYCHKLFLSTRSSYFDCLLKDHFQESSPDEEDCITRITLHEISPEVLASVLYFIYTNSAQLISEETVQELLWKADMFFLPELKRLCGNFLASTLSLDNVVSNLKVSRFYEIPKLEDICTGFMAKHIETLVDESGLHEIIIADAAEVHNREDTDSIPIVDDIRYHITMCVQTFSQVEVANQKLRIIDELLEKLSLDG